MELVETLRRLFFDSEARKIKREARLGAFPVCDVSELFCGDFGIYNEHGCTFFKLGNIFSENWVDSSLVGETTDTGEGLALEIGLRSIFRGSAGGGSSNIDVSIAANWKLDYYLKAKVKRTSLDRAGAIIEALNNTRNSGAPESSVNIRKLLEKYRAVHIVIGVWRGSGFLATGLNKSAKFSLTVKDTENFGAELEKEVQGSVVKNIGEDRPLFLNLAKMSECSVVAAHSSAASNNPSIYTNDSGNEYWVREIFEAVDERKEDTNDEEDSETGATTTKRLKQSAQGHQ